MQSMLCIGFVTACTVLSRLRWATGPLGMLASASKMFKLAALSPTLTRPIDHSNTELSSRMMIE